MRAAFDRYRNALLNRNGSQAADLVDRRTIDQYEEYVGLARTVDRKGPRNQELLAKLVVLRLRHDFDATSLATLSGRKLFETSVEKGWIADSQLESTVLGKVTVDGGQASVSI